MKIKYFLFTLFLLCISPIVVKADYNARFVADGVCSLSSSSTGNCVYKDTNFKSVVSGLLWLDTGDEVTVIESTKPVDAPKKGNGSECKSTYSYISTVYKSVKYYGYVCTDNIKTVTISEEFKQEMQEAGFPESYWESLALLREAHPTWKFIAIDTKLKFMDAVDNEDSGNKSLIQSTNSSTQGYLSTSDGNYNWDKDVFTIYDGSSWYAANQQTIAYYMDPRNFLADAYIFQFEGLSYMEGIQTQEAINELLGNSYLAKFAEIFMKAGVQTGVNPVYLASRSRQEIGGATTAGMAVSGAAFTYDGKKYKGLYNFYNIGATSGVGGSTARGLVYANGGANGKDTSYGRPWTTEEKAIIGGAEFIGNSYIRYGQDTNYFQKWNTAYHYALSRGIKEPYRNYTHQYMQNIQSPSTEARSTYRSYQQLNMLDTAYSFYIPVYQEMPEKTTLPPTGNPNNHLKTITIDGKKLEGFTSSNMNYKMTVDYTTTEVKVTATTINSAATVTGTGTISLQVGENPIDLKVKAQNGDLETYHIIIIRNEDDGSIVYPPVQEILDTAKVKTRKNYIVGLTQSSKVTSFKSAIQTASPTAKVEVTSGGKAKTTGELHTGDVVKITSGLESKTFEIVFYGDASGDGSITVLDLLKVQKDILKTSILSGAYKEAADVNKDGSITVLDLLIVQRHILGTTIISQN